MHALVTQTLDDSLQVALVTHSTKLGQLLATHLRTNGLSVEVFSLDQTNLSAAISQGNFYKIVVEMPVGEQVLPRWLEEYGQQVMEVWSVSSVTSTKHPVFNWLFSHSEKVALIDVVELTPDWLESMQVRAGEGIVSDLQLKVRPLSLASAVAALTPLIMAPWRGQSWSLHGKEVSTGTIAKALQTLVARVHQHSLTILIDPAHLTPTQITADHQVVKTESLSDVLDPVVEAWQHTVRVKSTQSATESQREKIEIQPKHVEVPPRLIPRIQAKSRQVVSQPVETPAVQSPKSPEKKTQSHEAELEASLAKMFQTTRQDQQTERRLEVGTQQVKIKKKNKRKRAAFVGGMGFMGAGLGVGVLLLFYIMSAGWFQTAFQASVLALLQGEAQAALPLTARMGKSLFPAQLKAYRLVLPGDWFDESSRLLEANTLVTDLATRSDKIQTLVQQAYAQVMRGEGGDVFSNLDTITSLSSEQYEQLSKLQADLDQLPESVSQAALSGNLDTSLTAQRRALSGLQQVLPLMRSLLAQEGKRTYAVVLQNNQELRPTGGFIQGIGLVTVERGLIIDTQVFSVYELEKNFSGQVEPPADVTRLLNEKNYFLHDANWDPHFPTTGERLTWYLEKMTGKPIQGVIAMDLYTLQKMIKATGPLELKQYNEVLTDRNLFERAEFHSEVKLTEGSADADYLAQVLRRFLEQLQVAPTDRVTPVMSAFHQSLLEHHTQIFLADRGEQGTVATLGWTGELITPQCPSQLSQANCVVDTITQVEANIGVNKANYYISRQIDHQVVLGQTQATHTRTIVFSNSATTNAWPRGTYRSYVRFYLPTTAAGLQVTLGSTTVPENQITRSVEHGRAVVGLVLEVPIQSSQELVVRYQVPHSLQAPFAYTLFDQKQSGTSGDKLSITLTHGDDVKPVLIAPQAQVVGNTVTFTDQRLDHTFVGVSFE